MQWRCWSVTGDGVGQGFDDRRRINFVSVAQAANPTKMSRFELVKSPATVVLQAMIMTAGGSDVVFGGGPTEGGVQGVVGIGATSSARLGSRS